MVTLRPGASCAADKASCCRPVFVLVTAAGASERFGGLKKELMPLQGRASTVLDAAFAPFLGLPDLAGAVLTAPANREKETLAALQANTRRALETISPCGFSVIAGGQTRQDSVRIGLEEITSRAQAAKLDLTHAIVLVHDGARPCASGALVQAVIKNTREKGACLPLVPLVDTPKLRDNDGLVTGHPARKETGAAQTPQGFLLAPFLDAHRRAHAEQWNCTDDTALWDRYVGPVAWIEGELSNIKITYRDDLKTLDANNTLGASNTQADFRIGEGWDIHRLASGRALLLGGVHIDFEKGELGHSDGDALWHAIIDAMLGAVASGDIGAHFPPSDPRWKDADSSALAHEAHTVVRKAGWHIANIDATIMLEKPLLRPYIDTIRTSIAKILDLAVDQVSVKAKTFELLGDVGAGLAVETRAIVLIKNN